MFELNTLLEVPYTGKGISYTCGEFLTHMSSPGVRPRLFVSYSTVKGADFDVVESIGTPKPISRLIYKLDRRLAGKVNEHRFKRAFTKGRRDVAYLFGETTAELAEWLYRNEIVVVREKVNCGKQMAKAILDNAYRRIGLPPQHGITDRDVAMERERLNLASYVFCANDFVEESVRDYGVDEHKIIRTSRGFSPARLSGGRRMFHGLKRPVFLFVGTVCVRKGSHLLLRAWSRGKIPGTLVFVGAMARVIRRLCASELAADNVVHFDYVDDIGSVFRSADAFVLPSLEEAGPKVTYEAAHCGLPCLVSPMGAGRVIHDGDQGMVLDPYDEPAWIEALHMLAANADLRYEMGEKASERAADFTWDKVGTQRSQELEGRARA